MIATERECGGWRAIALAMAVIGVGVVVAAAPSPGDAPAISDLQVGVLADGFVAAVSRPDGLRVVELSANGAPRVEHRLAIEGDARVVGTTAGPAVGVLAARKVHLVSASTGETLSVWGTNARTLCDGAATSAERFGVAWLEGDGTIWVVHGPTAAAGLELAATATAPTWCGVASAGPNLVLMWRDGARLYFNTCTKKSCRGQVSSIKLDARDAVLGAGCIEKSCLIATRAANGTAQLQLVTAAGGIKWRAALDTSASTVSIVGAGERGFVVGSPNTVRGIDVAGNAVMLWRAVGDTTAPKVAWARGRVLVAWLVGATLSTSTVAYP
jgi:hypothetical protein